MQRASALAWPTSSPRFSVVLPTAGSTILRPGLESAEAPTHRFRPRLALISPHEGHASTSRPGNSLSFGTVLTSFMGAWQDGQLSVGGSLGSGAIFEVGIGITITNSPILMPMGYSFSIYPLSRLGISLRPALSRPYDRPDPPQMSGHRPRFLNRHHHRRSQLQETANEAVERKARSSVERREGSRPGRSPDGSRPPGLASHRVAASIRTLFQPSCAHCGANTWMQPPQGPSLAVVGR